MTSYDPEPQHLSGTAQSLLDAAFRLTEDQHARADPGRACADCGDAECSCWPTEVPDQLDEQVKALMAELLDSADLDNIPSLEPLVADVLFLDTVTRIYGPSGSLKSFLTLSLAGAIGTGAEWYGRKVRQGTVLYLVAEGMGGMRKRVRAWEQHYGRTMTGVKFLPRPVQVKGPEWDALIEMCRRMDVLLIIIDTQARVTVGVNENDNTEMGVVLDLMERMRIATGACVLVVHHTGHENTERGRGASAVKGAMQTELGVTRTGRTVANTRVKLDMGKQKDDEEGPVETFRMKLIELAGEVKEDGSPITSIVLLPVDAVDDDEQPEEGSVEWLVRKLDAANVPSDWGSPKVRTACAELGLKARTGKIEEAVKIRKNRANQVPPHLPPDLESSPPPKAGGVHPVSPGQTSPQRSGGRSGEGTSDAPPPVPVPKDGGRSEAPRGKDGPIALCNVCFKTMTVITPNQTRHPMCTPKDTP